MKTLRDSLCVCLILCLCSFTFADSLVGHWKLDETSGDVACDSAGTNNGTVSGAVWTTGKIDGGLDFDGIDDKVIIPDNDVLTPTNAMTLSYWVYTSGTQEAGVYKFTPSGTRSYMFKVLANTQKAHLSIYAATMTYDNIESVGTVSLNAWHLITATFDSGIAKIYIDGALDNTKTLSVSTIGNDASSLTFGGSWSYDGGYEHWLPRLDGMIDDVRLYDYALNGQEVALLVPEPATMTLFALGSLLFVRRK